MIKQSEKCETLKGQDTWKKLKVFMKKEDDQQKTRKKIDRVAKFLQNS